MKNIINNVTATCQNLQCSCNIFLYTIIVEFDHCWKKTRQTRREQITELLQHASLESNKKMYNLVYRKYLRYYPPICNSKKAFLTIITTLHVVYIGTCARVTPCDPCYDGSYNTHCATWTHTTQHIYTYDKQHMIHGARGDRVATARRSKRAHMKRGGRVYLRGEWSVYVTPHFFSKICTNLLRHKPPKLQLLGCVFFYHKR